jgi:hypothetical protein
VEVLSALAPSPAAEDLLLVGELLLVVSARRESVSALATPAPVTTAAPRPNPTAPVPSHADARGELSDRRPRRPRRLLVDSLEEAMA